ncbi:MAG: MFS transporter [Solirubrobacteraceae bacterium]
MLAQVARENGVPERDVEAAVGQDLRHPAEQAVVVHTYGDVLLLAAAQLRGYFSAAWLVGHWGRKRTFVVDLSISAVCTFVYGSAGNLTVLLTAAVLMSFFALGASASLYVYTPELLPTRIRTTGMGAASGMARSVGVLAPLLGGAERADPRVPVDARPEARDRLQTTDDRSSVDAVVQLSFAVQAQLGDLAAEHEPVARARPLSRRRACRHTPARPARS